MDHNMSEKCVSVCESALPVQPPARPPDFFHPEFQIVMVTEGRSGRSSPLTPMAKPKIDVLFTERVTPLFPGSLAHLDPSQAAITFGTVTRGPPGPARALV